MPTHDDILKRFTKWARTQEDVRAAFVVGSRAREDTPSDAWSDLDLVFITTRPERYLEGSDWPREFGVSWISFTEPAAVGGISERRVLYEGAVDVDFVPVPRKLFMQMLDDGLPEGVSALLARGMRFIIDKDGLEARLRPATSRPSGTPLPTQDVFLNVVDSFWYHAAWVAKKLLRGELWTALGGHAYMRHQGLLPMLGWHAKVQHGPGYETWHSGRLLETWADPRAVASLRGVFPAYDAHSLRDALFALMELFGPLAAETAEGLGYAYPHDAQAHATAWTMENLAE